MITNGSGVDQNKKSPSFLPIGQKMPILHENLEFLMVREKFPLKKGNFWPMGQKDGYFLFWSTLKPLVITHLLKTRFFRNPVILSMENTSYFCKNNTSDFNDDLRDGDTGNKIVKIIFIFMYAALNHSLLGKAYHHNQKSCQTFADSL